MTEEIWKAARRAFGKEIYKAWPMICKRWEHALWKYNDQFGPLNEAQRLYFIAVVISSLDWAGNQRPEHRYASFQASLSSNLNRERVLAGFRSRASTGGTPQLDIDAYGVHGIPQ